MRFVRVAVTRFGPLSEFEPGAGSPLPGLVIVLGPNEAGKSTFHRVLTSLIHGIYPATRDQNPFTPWKGGDIEIGGTIALDSGEEWEVQRRLLSTPRGHLVRGGATDPLDNRSLPCASHVSSAIYSQVYAIGLADLAGVEREPWDAVRDHLIVGMGSDDLRAPREVAEELNARAASLWRPTRKGNSRHRELEAEMKELRSRRDDALKRDRRQREALGRALALDRTLDELRREKVAAAARVERLRTLVPLRVRLERLDRMEAPLGPIEGLRELPRDPAARLRELHDRAEAERRRAEEREAMDGRLREAGQPLFDALPADDEELATFGQRVAAVPLTLLDERIAGLEDETGRIRALEERLEELSGRAPQPPEAIPKIGFLLGALALGILTAALALRDPIFGIAGGVFLIVSTALIARALELRARRVGLREAHEAEVRNLQSRLPSAQRARDEREKGVRELLEPLSLSTSARELQGRRLVSDLERLAGLFRERSERGRPREVRAEAELQAFLAALRRAGGSADADGAERVAARIIEMEKVDRAREELEGDAGEIEVLRDKIQEAERDGEVWVEVPERLAGAEAEVEEIDSRMQRARDEQTAFRRDAAHDAKDETVDLVDSHIEEVREQMRTAERERDRLFVLARLLERAEATFRETHQPELLRRAERHLARITGGRYARILTGRGDDPNALHLHANHLPHPTPVESPLSTGTREQVYLALRLAIVDHLDEGKETLPLLLDEILVNWDPERRQRVLDLLVELSRSRQIFLFTCHPHLAGEVARAGGRVIELPAP